VSLNRVAFQAQTPKGRVAGRYTTGEEHAYATTTILSSDKEYRIARRKQKITGGTVPIIESTAGAQLVTVQVADFRKRVENIPAIIMEGFFMQVDEFGRMPFTWTS
jgi:hypothetical protein